MSQRTCHVFFLYLGINIFLLGLMFAHAYYRQGADKELLGARRKIVKDLQLTDLCLFTDARYARHPSMADLNTPFQDYPLSLEHFPSGSLLSVPPHLQARKRDR
jgi:hypothetical protein